MNLLGITVVFLIGAAIFWANGFCAGIDFERSRINRYKWKHSKGNPKLRASHYSTPNR